MPEYHDLHLLDSMLKRRQVLTEIGRTLSTLRDGILRSCGDEPTGLESVERFESRIKAWVADMDGMLSTMASHLALNDARRLQKLTVLAFVFVPASAIATIFGMNVDILSSEPSIAWFIATAVVTMAFTFAYATWFSQLNKLARQTVSVMLLFWPLTPTTPLNNAKRIQTGRDPVPEVRESSRSTSSPLMSGAGGMFVNNGALEMPVQTLLSENQPHQTVQDDGRLF
ncbi:hypothetical protein N656DRAFT_802192 [Canariomyces notabilis]|uniref:Uncharacterized protein n=1 Tax=Canariomyces notabilis TaxID=2074819 RepID=A0AAN6QDH6_9PEZI|nr:hypothetical protein N656DRAFT_802192 [Canariomyces arenarius]